MKKHIIDFFTALAFGLLTLLFVNTVFGYKETIMEAILLFLALSIMLRILRLEDRIEKIEKEPIIQKEG